MATIRCKVLDNNGAQCESTIDVSLPLAENAGFICKNHPRAAQVRANSRQYDPARDEADKGVHFQEAQFDPDLRRPKKPQGTEHIHHQGNEKRITLDRDGQPRSS